MKYLKYLWYVLRHKWYVFLACTKHGHTWHGIIHDWSKFRPSEFFPYAEHFYGKGKDIKSGRSSTGYYKPTDTGDKAFDRAWFYHQKRNKHHWQYWCLPEDEQGLISLEIPDKYCVEMLCDWLGASRAQGNGKIEGVLKWYETNKHKLQLNGQTREDMEDLLEVDRCNA